MQQDWKQRCGAFTRRNVRAAASFFTPTVIPNGKSTRIFSTRTKRRSNVTGPSLKSWVKSDGFGGDAQTGGFAAQKVSAPRNLKTRKCIDFVYVPPEYLCVSLMLLESQVDA